MIRSKLEAATIISIAHKLTSILDYDEILVFEKGNVVERGTSKELFHQKGVFYSMINENKDLRERVLKFLKEC